MRLVARPIGSANPREILIGVFGQGTELPVRTLTEIVPESFPQELAPILADFLARGFNAAQEAADERHGEISLVEFAPSLRGRPTDDETEREGREGTELRKQGLTFGQIARQVCRSRGKPGHRCNKKCVDRIRQATVQHEHQEYLRQLQNPE